MGSGVYFKGGKVFGGPKEGDTDTFLTQTFDNVVLSDFTQTGLIIDTVSPISGAASAKLIHQSGIPQSFKETRTVPERFRGAPMVVAITGKSGADLGNVTILFRDETNNANIQTSQQVPLISSVKILQYGVLIPSNCTSFSYTVTALAQSGSPETFIDDVTIRNYWLGTSVQGQTQYRMDVPVITSWETYVPTFTGFGTVSGVEFYWRRVGSNIEIMGQFTSGIPTAVPGAISYPNGLSAASGDFGTSRPSHGTWYRKISSTDHGGTIIADAGTVFNFSDPTTFSGTASNPGIKTNADSLVGVGNVVSLSMTAPILGWNHIETKTFTTVDLAPARSMSSNATVEVPVITPWQSYTPTFQGFGTPTGINFRWRRVGESIEVSGEFTSGVTTAEQARVGLPNGNLISNQVLNTEIAGSFGWSDSANPSVFPLRQGGEGYFTFASQTGTGGSVNDGENANARFSSGDRLSFSASAPIQGWATTESKTWTSTQSVVTEDADSIFRGRGFTGNGSTNTGILTLSANVSNIGDALTYVSNNVLGDSWVVNKAGIYNFHASIDTSGSGSYNYYFTKNATTLTAASASAHPFGIVISNSGYANLNNDVTQVSGSEYLNVGDTIRFHCAASGVSNTNSTTYDFLIISYQGSTKLVQTVPDQKIDIPVSELRFENASARGTGLETNTILFTSMTKIVGDAFTVDSTNGTRITVNRDGIVNISGSVYYSTSGYAYVTKNQAAASAIISEFVTGAGNNASAPVCSLSGSFPVRKGDVLRVYSPTNAPTANAGTTLTITHQEQKIAVAVTNVLPQFSDSDSSVRATTANGWGSSNTDVRRFSSLSSNIGSDVSYSDSATLGAAFAIMTSGVYSIKYSDAYTTAGSFGIVRNWTAGNLDAQAPSQVLAAASTASGEFIADCSWTGYLYQGDVIRPVTNSGYANSTVRPHLTSFTVSKVGKPNVTGVDITPFANIPQAINETIEFGGLGTQATNNNFRLDPLSRYSNSGVIAYTTNATTGARFTALKKCIVTASFSAGGAAVKDVQVRRNGIRINSGYSAQTTAADTGFAGCSIFLDVGEYLEFYSGATGFTNAQLTMVATANSDQILTPSETFSTDTANLVYAPSSLYTPATLPSAPIGTIITYNGGANAQAITQTTTPPTQTVSSMQSNGILITAKPYSVAGSANTPTRFAIQIGKGMKGVTVSAYVGAGKSGEVIDLGFFTNGSTIEAGTIWSYSETTGILDINAGFAFFSNTTRYVGSTPSSSNPTSGYFVINASKNPALTGINATEIIAKGVNTSGQVIGSAGQTVLYDATKEIDTTGSLNSSTGLFTAPESGYYLLTANVWFSTKTYANGNGIYFYFQKNGTNASTIFINRLSAISDNAGINGSDIIYLVKGDTASVFAYNQSGNTALGRASFAITKL